MLDVLLRKCLAGQMPVPSVCYFNVLTQRVPAMSYWPYRERHAAFMGGLLYQSEQRKSKVGGGFLPMIVFEVIASECEGDIVDGILQRIVPDSTMVYSALKDFDRDVLCALYTSATTPTAERPGRWPHIELDEYDWLNIRDALLPKETVTRLPDCSSAQAAMLWAKCDRMRAVLHCARNVAELALRDPVVDKLPPAAEQMLRGVCADPLVEEVVLSWRADPRGNPAEW